ncbi:DUF305 domain-containing protein [Polymorphospora rubra]
MQMVTSVEAEVSTNADTSAPGDSTERRPAPRYSLVVVAIALVVGLLAGYAGGWITPTLTRPGEGSPEVGFARDMSAHHAQAVEMGLIAFRNATDPDTQQIGIDIAAAQQGEIGTMQTWLRFWDVAPSGPQAPMAWMPDGAEAMRDRGNLMPGMATPEQMAELRAATGIQVDLLFIKLMRDHHLGGIHMADAIIDMTDDPEVIAVATTMKNTQQTEIANFNALEKRLTS